MSYYNNNILKKILTNYTTTSAVNDMAQNIGSNPYDDGTRWSSPMQEEEGYFNPLSAYGGKTYNRIAKQIYGNNTYKDPNLEDELSAPRNQMKYYTGQLQKLGEDIPEPDEPESFGSKALNKTFDIIGVLGAIPNAFAGGVKEILDKSEGNNGKEWKTDDSPLGIIKDVYDILGKGFLGSGLSTVSAPLLGDKVRDNIVDVGMALDTARESSNSAIGKVLGGITQYADTAVEYLNPVSLGLKMAGKEQASKDVAKFITNFGTDVLLSSKVDLNDLGKGLKYLNSTDEIKKIANIVDDANANKAFNAFKNVKRSGIEQEVKLALKDTPNVTDGLINEIVDNRLNSMRDSQEFKALIKRTNKALGGLEDFEGVKLGKKTIITPEQLEKLGSKTGTKIASNIIGGYLNPFATAYSLGKGSTKKLLGNDNMIAKAFMGGSNQALYKSLNKAFNEDDIYNIYRNVQMMNETKYARNIKQFMNDKTITEIDELAETLRQNNIDPNEISDIIETHGTPKTIQKEVLENVPNRGYVKDVMSNLGSDIDDVKQSGYYEISDVVNSINAENPELVKPNIEPVRLIDGIEPNKNAKYDARNILRELSRGADEDVEQLNFLDSITKPEEVLDSITKPDEVMDTDNPITKMVMSEKERKALLNKKSVNIGTGNDLGMKPTEPSKNIIDRILERNIEADPEYLEKSNLKKQLIEEINNSNILNKEQYLKELDLDNMSVDELNQDIKFYKNKQKFRENSYNRSQIRRENVIKKIESTNGKSIYSNVEVEAQNSIDELLEMRRLVVNKGNIKRYKDVYGKLPPAKGDYKLSEDEARKIFDNFIESNKDILSEMSLKETMKKEKQIIEAIRYFGGDIESIYGTNTIKHPLIQSILDHTSTRYGKPINIVSKVDEGIDNTNPFKTMNDIDLEDYERESKAGNLEYSKAIQNDISRKDDIKEFNKNLTKAGEEHYTKEPLEYMGSNIEDKIANNTLPSNEVKKDGLRLTTRMSKERVKNVSPSINKILDNIKAEDPDNLPLYIGKADTMVTKLAKIGIVDEDFVNSIGLNKIKTAEELNDIAKKVNFKYKELNEAYKLDNIKLNDYKNNSMYDIVKNNSVLSEEDGIKELSKIMGISDKELDNYFNGSKVIDDVPLNPLEKAVEGSDNIKGINTPVEILNYTDTTVKLNNTIHNDVTMRNKISNLQLDTQHNYIKQLGKKNLDNMFNADNVEKEVTSLLKERADLVKTIDRLTGFLEKVDIKDKGYKALSKRIDDFKIDLENVEKSIEGLKNTKGIYKRNKTLKILSDKMKIYEDSAKNLEEIGIDASNLAKKEIDFETASKWFENSKLTSNHPKYDTVNKLVDEITHIDTIGTLDETTQEFTKKIVNIFKELGVKEDLLDLKSYGEFTGYVTHALSDTTKENMEQVERVLRKYNFDLSNPFNVNSLSRDLRGTIKEINKVMSNEYGIENFFETNILKLVSDRMLHSNKIQYSNTIKNLYESMAIKIDTKLLDAQTPDMIRKILKDIGGVESGITLKQGIGANKQLVDLDIKKGSFKNDPTKIGAKINMYDPATKGRQIVDYDVNTKIELSPGEEKAGLVSDLYKRLSEIKTGRDKNFVLVRQDIEEVDKPIRKLKDKVMNKFEFTEAEYVDNLDKEMDNLLNGAKNEVNASGFVNAGIDDTEEEILKKIQKNEYIIMDRSVYEQYNKVCNDSIGKDISKFRKIYDKAMNFFKAWAVTSPSFHVNNMIGNEFNSVLDVGASVFSSKVRKQAKSIIKEIESCTDGDFSRLTGTIGGVSKKEFAEQCVKNGILSGFFDIDMQSVKGKIQSSIDGTNTQESTLKRMLGKVNPLTPNNNIIVNKSQKIGQSIEVNSKMRNVIAHIEKGDNIFEAMDKTNSALFDYGDLTDFETNVIKRYVAPFYTYASKNIPYQVEKLANQTGKYYPLKKLYDYTNREMDDKERYSKPDYASEGIRIGEGKYLNVETPLSSMANMGSSKGLMQSLNPFIKAPLNYVYNKDSQTGSEISKTDDPLEKLLYSTRSVAPVIGTSEKIIKGFTGTEKDKDTLKRWLTANKIKEYDTTQAEKQALYRYVNKLEDKYYDILEKRPELREYLKELKNKRR